MKMLVVVDYQNDFVEGALGFEKAKNLEPIIYNKVMKCIENNDVVVFTKDTHYEDNYLETQEGRNLPIPHCIYQTYGWELYGRLYDVLNKYHTRDAEVYEICKDTFGCYGLGEFITDFGWGLDDELENIFDEIEVCGVVTNMCVISNAVFIKTIAPEVKITIDALACASNNDELHEKALDVLESMQFQVINREMKQLGRTV